MFAADIVEEAAESIVVDGNAVEAGIVFLGFFDRKNALRVKTTPKILYRQEVISPATSATIASSQETGAIPAMRYRESTRTICSVNWLVAGRKDLRIT